MIADGRKAFLDELLAAVRQGAAEKLLAEDCRYDVLYALSPERENLFAWAEWPQGASVLEVGCGCGALTGGFLRAGLSVQALARTKAEAEVVRARYPEASRLSVCSMEDDGRVCAAGIRFDFVTLVGTLEEAPLWLPSESSPFAAMMAKAAEALREGGQLFVAADNRLGARYFSGAPEKYTGQRFAGLEGYPARSARTFSRRELSELLAAAGFVAECWYYPYPDYAFPAQVFSDERLPHREDFAADIEALSGERLMMFDERLFLQSVSPEDFPMFANSFLVQARRI